MPMSYAVEKTPKGRSFVRTVSSGAVTADDVKGFSSVIGPGQPLAGFPILALVEPGADFSPESRKVFGGMGGQAGAATIFTAVVVPSAPLRVMISFIVKVAGASDGTRFFANEPEARSWLFDKVDA